MNDYRNEARNLQLKDPTKNVHSNPPKEFHGFRWILLAKSMENGFLGLYLLAKPLNANKEHWIGAEITFRLMHPSLSKALPIMTTLLVTYEDNFAEPEKYMAHGVIKMAKFDDLLEEDSHYLQHGDTTETIKARVEINVFDSSPTLLDHLNRMAKATKKNGVNVKVNSNKQQLNPPETPSGTGQQQIQRTKVEKKPIDGPINSNNVRLVIVSNELDKKDFEEKSHPIGSLGFTWYLHAFKTNGFLSLKLEVEPSTKFINNHHMEADYRIALLNTRGKNLVQEGNGEIGFTKNRYGNIKLNYDFGFRNVAKIEDLLVPANGFLHNGSIVVKADFSITYSLLLVIENCEGLFKQPKFSRSIWQLGYAPIANSPPQGTFDWQLEATTWENGWLAVYLHAKPPAGYKGKYNIEVDYRLYLLNANNGKHLISDKHGQVCTDEHNTGWGNPKIAKLTDLLDKAIGFLRPNGSIEVLAKFSIKSFVIDPITIPIT